MVHDFNCHIETGGLQKSLAVTYIVKVYYYQKRRKIETLLLQTTNSTHHGLRGSASPVLTATGLASGQW